MQTQSGAAIAATAAKLGLAVGLEIILLVLHFAVYIQTINVLPVDLYLPLIELPAVGFLFAWDPDFTLAHLLSAVFATATVVLPVMIWRHIFAEDILDDAGSYFVGLLPKLQAAIVIAVYGGLVTLEFKMLYARVQANALNPFAGAGDASPEGLGFAIFVSAMAVLVNFALAMFTGRLWVDLNDRLSEFKQQYQGVNHV